MNTIQQPWECPQCGNQGDTLEDISYSIHGEAFCPYCKSGQVFNPETQLPLPSVQLCERQHDGTVKVPFMASEVNGLDKTISGWVIFTCEGIGVHINEIAKTDSSLQVDIDVLEENVRVSILGSGLCAERVEIADDGTLVHYQEAV